MAGASWQDAEARSWLSTRTRHYTQLCFFAYLFDAAQAVAETRDTAQQTRLQSIMDAHRADIDALHGTVQSYLARNGRRFVGLGKLFSFMRM